MLNEFGQEIPDDTPVSIHIPGLGQVNDVDEIRRIIREQISFAAMEAEMETEDDANDFDVDDDMFPAGQAEYDELLEAGDLEALRGFDPTAPQGQQPPAEPGKPAGGPPGPDTVQQRTEAAKPAPPVDPT